MVLKNGFAHLIFNRVIMGWSSNILSGGCCHHIYFHLDSVFSSSSQSICIIYLLKTLLLQFA